jgi:hypothetical protein
MAADPEHPTPSRRRPAVLAVAVALLLLVLLAGGYVWFREHTAYHGDIASCVSDNMYVLKERLNDYAAEHDGRTPATFDELRAHVKDKDGAPHDVCVRAHAPFIWMPEGVKTDDGHPVVLMCPPDSHGWLRKYAFGLARDDDGAFYFVRIRHGRATPFPDKQR